MKNDLKKLTEDLDLNLVVSPLDVVAQDDLYRFTDRELTMVREMASSGMDRASIARVFQISPEELAQCYRQNLKFRAAIDVGRDLFGSHVAEASMMTLIKGYDLIEVTEEPDDTGNMTESKRVHKHVPPNQKAIEYYLNNRAADIQAALGTEKPRWSPTQKLEVTGKDGEKLEMGWSPEKFLAAMLKMSEATPEQIALEAEEAPFQIEDGVMDIPYTEEESRDERSD